MFIATFKNNSSLFLKVASLTLLFTVSIIGYVFYVANASILGLPVVETSDVKIYKNAAEFLVSGKYLYGDEYRYFSGVDLPWRMSPFSALIFAPLIFIPDELIYPVQIVFNIILIVIIIVLILGKVLEQVSPKFATVMLVGLTFITTAYSPIQNIFITGQVNLFLMFLILVDTIYVKGKHPKIGGFLVGVAAGIKIIPLIFIVYYFLTKQYRSVVNALTGFVLTILIGFIVSAENSLEYWFNLLFIKQTGELEAVFHNQSINGIILKTDSIPEELKQITWLIIAGIVGTIMIAFSAYLYKYGRTLEPVILVGFASLLCSPLSWIHHGVWVLPAMLLILKYAEDKQKYFFYWVFGSILLVKQYLGIYEPNIISALLKSTIINSNWWVILYIIFSLPIIVKNVREIGLEKNSIITKK